MVLVLFTALRGDFVNAYADENSLRWVMWWQRSNTPPQSGPVFEATKVSREILMFQLMVVDLVIGDVPETLKAMETTNCKLPDRLELLQGEWRKRKQSTGSWSDYFKNIGSAQPKFGSTAEWINDCAKRAAAKGPKYGGGKGSGGKGGNSSSSAGGKGGKGDGRGKGGWQARGW